MELEFVKAFTYLLKIRFHENLKINIHLEDVYDLNIPPLTLQILIENAIKHNTFNVDRPLEITLGDDGEYISITNTLFLKAEPEPESGIGISNLKNRFRFFTDKPILIYQDNSIFSIRIPKIKS